MDKKQEQKLVKQAKESLKAFDELYEYYLPRIYGYILNRTANRAVTEDITSQTFIKAMTKIKTFKYQGYSFGSWLYRIAHNNLVDYYRKSLPLRYEDYMDSESEEKTEKEVEQFETRKVVLTVLQQLPPQYQQILSLKYFEELSNEEIANIVGCRKTTLAVKLHRSLKSFKKILEKGNYSDALSISF